MLFADEPTGSLDSLTGEQVMDLLSSAARASGTTVVLVTHEPRVAAYADRQVVVRDGRVTVLTVDSGRHVIRLGLRLTLRRRREAAVRLVLTSSASRSASAMLLITFAGINGVNAQNARWSWLQSRRHRSGVPHPRGRTRSCGSSRRTSSTATSSAGSTWQRPGRTRRCHPG